MTKVFLDSDLHRNGAEAIRIILADDHPLLRQALRQVLEKQESFEIVAEACDGEEAIKLTMEYVPDIVIMDISMPKVNGLEATRQIKEKLPQVAILVLTVHDDNEHILSLLEAGASGYLTKSVFNDELIYAVLGVSAGETVLGTMISKQVIRQAVRNVTKPVPLISGEKITSRELEVLKLAANGLSNKDISERVSLSLRTVKGHLVEIYSKLNAGSRTEAVINALRADIINIEDIK